MVKPPAPVCTIVGMGPGLSQALAARFAAGGFAIGMVARTPSTLERMSALLEQQGAKSQGAVADVADAGALTRALAAVHAALGEPDVLIFNASTLRMAVPSQLEPADLAQDLAVNVGGALAAAQAVLPSMRARGSGCIIFTGGGSAFEPWVDAASLGVGKAAMRNLALAFARELAPAGIHAATVTVCGAIAPGTWYDPARIAEVFWDLHEDAPGAFRGEVLYREP